MNTRKIEITEKGTREYYKELVNITSQYRSLIKKPDMKLRNKLVKNIPLREVSDRNAADFFFAF